MYGTTILKLNLRRLLEYLGRLFGTRQTLTEDPISPDERLAISLYRLGRVDYYYTIAEMVGRDVLTVSSIVEEVSQVLVNHL